MTTRPQLPAGLYFLTADRVVEKKKSVSGHDLYLVAFRWAGTDRDDLLTFYSSGGMWAWSDMVDNFEDIPTIIGRTFLYEIKEDPGVVGEEYPRHRLHLPLAEVLP